MNNYCSETAITDKKILAEGIQKRTAYRYQDKQMRISNSFFPGSSNVINDIYKTKASKGFAYLIFFIESFHFTFSVVESFLHVCLAFRHQFYFLLLFLPQHQSNKPRMTHDTDSYLLTQPQHIGDEARVRRRFFLTTFCVMSTNRHEFTVFKTKR